MTAESFDAVLAEMRADAEREVTVGWATRMARYADRLQAAHEMEVGELRSAAGAMADQLLSARMNRMTAEGLLRRAVIRTSDDELKAQVDAFLAHGGQEKQR